MKSRAQIAALAGLLLLVATVDFVARIHVGRDASLRAFQPPEPRPLPEADTLESIRAQMAGWLPDAGGLGPAGGTAGQPLPLALQGVFVMNGKATAALVAAAPSRGPAGTVHAVEGEVVHGWTVTRIDQHGVTLQAGDGTRELQLFSPGPAGAAGPGSPADVLRQAVPLPGGGGTSPVPMLGRGQAGPALPPPPQLLPQAVPLQGGDNTGQLLMFGREKAGPVDPGSRAE